MGIEPGKDIVIGRTQEYIELGKTLAALLEAKERLRALGAGGNHAIETIPGVGASALEALSIFLIKVVAEDSAALKIKVGREDGERYMIVDPN